MESLADPQAWASLFTLTVLEVVLSIDNLVVIAVLVAKLPKAQQASARYIGMTLALLPRLVLLLFIGWIIGLTEPLFELFGHGLSGKDLILAAGGLFLIYKATHEIHGSLEGDEGEATARVLANFTAVVVQIALINLVFSIDSIVTAVGMANVIWVMAVAVIVSMIVLMVASGPVADFVERHPTVKILALGFLIMIGMALVADSFGVHIPKGYIYAAMLFSVFIESINMLHRRRMKPVHLRNPYGPENPPPDERRVLAAPDRPRGARRAASHSDRRHHGP
jgi:predicted tellurium resistance membrane protein TerC